MREKGHKINIRGDEYDSSDLDNSLLRNEIFEKLKNIKYTGLLDVSTDVDDSIGYEHVNIDKMHKVSAPISMKVHRVCRINLPIIHTINIAMLKIWSIDCN